jgi:hypothetical protein
MQVRQGCGDVGLVEGELARSDARLARTGGSQCSCTPVPHGWPCSQDTALACNTGQDAENGRDDWKRKCDLRLCVRVFGEQTACDALVQAQRVVALVARLGARASDMRNGGNVVRGVQLGEVILAGGRLGALAPPFEYPRHATAVVRRCVAAAAFRASPAHLVQRAIRRLGQVVVAIVAAGD